MSGETVEGIGVDDIEMIDGARTFDITTTKGPNARWLEVLELTAFPGPAGLFFGDGTWLYSSDSTGFSRWDLNDGARTGHLPDFRPTHYHQGAREFAQIVDGVLARCRIAD
jgi:hypothetical protein